MKMFLSSMKTLILKIAPRAASKFSFQLLFLKLVDFLQCYTPYRYLLDAGKIRENLLVIGGFGTIVKSHRRVRKPEQAL